MRRVGCATFWLLIASAPVCGGPPAPLLAKGKPVEWWFVFKFNAATFDGCGAAKRNCQFGGTVQDYAHFGQQFAFASSRNGTLAQGKGCAGCTANDPVGATFRQVYRGKLFYAIWNDQFHGDPMADKASPAGHAKGVLAWDKNGDGFLMQVSTPSWPGSGNSKTPRKTDGNTLGCVENNNVLVSQHFFAVKLNAADVAAVLKALGNASVVTDPANPQIVRNGGPEEIQALVKELGTNSRNTTATTAKLSNGVTVISKPSRLGVPPWQMVSALLGSEPLRVATWYTTPEIPTTTATTQIGCWDESLGRPGAVANAISGTWDGRSIGLDGGPTPNGNHAKIGVSTGTHQYAIFGDLNQQGAIKDDCKSSQNGRGGLFFVVEQPAIHESLQALLAGDTAP